MEVLEVGVGEQHTDRREVGVGLDAEEDGQRQASKGQRGGGPGH